MDLSQDCLLRVRKESLTQVDQLKYLGVIRKTDADGVSVSCDVDVASICCGDE